MWMISSRENKKDILGKYLNYFSIRLKVKITLTKVIQQQMTKEVRALNSSATQKIKRKFKIVYCSGLSKRSRQWGIKIPNWLIKTNTK